MILFRSLGFGELWFEPSVDESVRNAALGYIVAVGSVDFTPFAEIELSRNNYATRQSALEAILQLLGRESVRKAAEYAVEASFDEIGSAALEPVLAGFRELSEESLVKALDHRSGLIRAKAIKTLSERRLLKPEQVRRFFGDASLETRKAAVAASEAAGLRLSLEELKEALVLKEVKNGLGSNNNYDYEGNAVFDIHKRSRLAERTIAALDEALVSDPISADEYYSAIAEGHFSTAAGRIRYDFDDRFQNFWADYLKGLRRQFGDKSSETIISIVARHRKIRRRQMMRSAIDALMSNPIPEDLPRIRKAVDEDALDPRSNDIDYFIHSDAWEDIQCIAKMAGDYRTNPGFGMLMVGPSHLQHASMAILKLAGDRLAEVLAMDLSDALVAKLIGAMPMAVFRRLGRSTIESLLVRKADQIRKAAALQIIISLNSRDARRYLDRYLSLEDYRCYNVIFWLDLCVAFDRNVYRAISQRELKKL